MPAEQGHGPSKRGRRDPELAAELALDPATFDEDGEANPEPPLVYEGDVVTCKITREVEIAKGYSTFLSYGVTTRVQPNEDEESVFVRTANTCHIRVGQLVEAEEEAYQAELEERRNAPIRHNG